MRCCGGSSNLCGTKTLCGNLVGFLMKYNKIVKVFLLWMIYLVVSNIEGDLNEFDEV